MGPQDWQNALEGTLAVFLNGHANRTPDPLGGLYGDSSFLFLINPSASDHVFELPAAMQLSEDHKWRWCLDTSLSAQEATDMLPNRQIDHEVEVKAHSIVLLEQPPKH